MNRRLTTAIAAAAALAVTVLPACGEKTDESTRAAGIVPADTIGLLSVNLEPAIEQQRHILSIARALPGDLKVDEGDWEDARGEFLEGFFEDTGLDFEDDVKPWIGSEVALAAFASERRDAPPHPVLLIDCDDRAKAEAALERLEDDDYLPGPYAFLDDFVAIGLDGSDDGLDVIEAHIEGDADSLADSATFNGVVDELHGDRLILGYVDGEQALDLVEEFSGSSVPVDVSAGPVAFDLHAQAKTLVFEGVTKATGADRGQPIDYVLPEEAVAALTVVGLLDGLEDAAAEFGPMIEEAIGLDVQEDLLSWLGERVTVVVAPPATELVPIPRFGLVIEVTDEAKAQAAVPKIQSLIDTLIDGGAEQLGSELAEEFAAGMGAEFPEEFAPETVPEVTTTTAVAPSPPLQPNPFRPTFELDGDQLIVSLTPGFVTTLKNLEADPDATPSVMSLFVDADRLARLIEQPELGDVLDTVRARAGRDGDFDRFELRVSFG